VSDFLLDLRPPEQRRVKVLAERLRFLPHIQLDVLATSAFDLAVTCPVSPELWRPFSNASANRFVALSGRVALSDAEWEQARVLPGEGGWACKALDSIYAQHGIQGLEKLSGNFVLLVWDGAAGLFHLVTDCTGVFPVYECQRADASVFGSHPDVLAAAAGEQENFDDVSLAEFAITSMVSPPFTYYQNLRAVGRAMTVSFRLQSGRLVQIRRHCHFPLEFQGRPTDQEDDLADELAVTFRNAVARRSSPRLGRCAVALSGGLDSRAVLASVAAPSNTLAFTCYDKANQELRSAAAIARAAGVEFFPRQRPFDYYGDNAPLGMRVAGGMGSIANNHFLGVLPWLREQGVQVFLTGCYCDYLFKGLPLNRRMNPLTGRETLAPYRRQFYFDQSWPATGWADQVRDRIDARFPAALTNDRSDAAIFELEQRRTFPLCYEADNAQRVVPQRLTGWFVPVSDPDLMRVYCRIPYRWKLNRSIFRKAVNRICGHKLIRVQDTNTGAPADASTVGEALSFFGLRFRSRFARLKSSLATSGSWPDWHYYIANSRRIASLWSSPNRAAHDLFERVLNHNNLSSDVRTYHANDTWLLVKLLSLKLWLEQRAV
jgi:asparagine synthase (glutamine-hydrolysing)